MKPILIAGCGDIGRRVARLYRVQGASVWGIVCSETSARRLRAGGVEPLLGDLANRTTLKDQPTTEAVIFYFAPPPAQGERDPLIQNFLATIDPVRLPAKVVLISTTAVYGDCQGAWITEAQAAEPQTARGRRRLDAENILRRWGKETDVPFVTLRVGGIYGPGRLPMVRLEKGLPILDPVESPYTNRIHQDDLARVCKAAAERGVSGEIYNVSDGHPSTMSQYFIDVAKALGLPLPPVVSRAEAEKVMSAGMLSYLQESRRLENRKMSEELAIELRYPDLAAGLAALKRN